MKKCLLMMIAFLCIQHIEATEQNYAQEGAFKRIISLLEVKNGVGFHEEEALASLQKEYENICVVCGGTIESEDACKKLTISCVDEPETFSRDLKDGSSDVLREECPETTFVFSVHKKCEFHIGRYLYLKNICNISFACKAGAVCCLVGGALIIGASWAYILI